MSDLDSIDSLIISDNDNIEVITTRPSECIDNKIQTRILHSVSRVDHIRLLTSTRFSSTEDGGLNDEDLILSDLAYTKRLWMRLLSGSDSRITDEHFDQFMCPISLEWLDQPVHLHKVSIPKVNLKFWLLKQLLIRTHMVFLLILLSEYPIHLKWLW